MISGPSNKFFDPEFGVTCASLTLEREVSMYQWVEHIHEQETEVEPGVI